MAQNPTSPFDGDEDDAVCYAEGYGIKEMYQMCDVTSTCRLAGPATDSQIVKSSRCSPTASPR